MILHTRLSKTKKSTNYYEDVALRTLGQSTDLENNLSFASEIEIYMPQDRPRNLTTRFRYFVKKILIILTDI